MVRVWRAREFSWALDRTLLMGVLNVTPDSFSDGGLFAAHEAALAHGLAMAREGADIVDVGGESTRPGHVEVPTDEEIARVVPVIRDLARHAPVSIDTYKAATARAALEAGAAIVNDVWGFRRDPDIARVAAEFGAGAVLMDNRSIDPGVDIVPAIIETLSRSIEIALAAGLSEEAIVTDPGIGFGKTLAQNLEAIDRLDEIAALGFPVLLGASRKSSIGRITGREVPAERVHGTLGAHITGALRGASIIRAHDIAAHVDALRVADAIRARGWPLQGGRV